MSMRTSLGTEQLAMYVAKQLSAFFPDAQVNYLELLPHVSRALERVEHCFTRVRRRGYFDLERNEATFDHLFTDQYASFLWFLGNTIHVAGGDRRVATKTYALNKALHGLDVYFEVAMPSVFCFQHPVGTVIGRATLSDYLFVYQNVNIGGSIDLDYPTLGEGVVLFNGAAVTGPTKVSANVWIGPGAQVKSGDIASGSIVFGAGPSQVVKKTERSVRAHFFAQSQQQVRP
jgi:serine O-acetyltransferase